MNFLLILPVLTAFVAVNVLSESVPNFGRPPWMPPVPTQSPENFKGTYLIVAPKVFRSGLPYAASVNILSSDGPIHVSLSIRDGKNTTIAESKKKAKVGKPINIRFDNVTNVNTAEAYRLYAIGTSTGGAIVFDNNQDLRFETKSLSIFVQTDKAIYKPGSAVHYRVIVVTPDLKPVNDQEAIVKVTDPANNVIQQVKKPLGPKGLIESDITLSDEPPLGDWKIEVNVNGQQYIKTFSVEKYVLPKFEVKVTPPSYTTINDDIAVLVAAKYTYGKGVHGTVEVKAKYPWSFGAPPITENTELDDNGQATIRFQNNKLKAHNLINDIARQSNIKFTAVVTESLTNIQRNGTGEIIVYKYATKVTIAKPSDNFKPGLDYTFKVAAVQPDDKPLASAAGAKVFVKINYMFAFKTDANGTAITKEPERKVTEVILDYDGTKSVTIQPPNDANTVDITASYQTEDSEVFDSAHLDAAKSPTSSFIQVIAQQQGTIEHGQKVTFVVRATEDIPFVTAQVMSRGVMLLTREIKIDGKEGTFNFTTTPAMAPKARLVVYAIRPANKEILVDALDFNVHGLFQNDVSISVNTNQSEPNNTVEFRVVADANSYVGLLAVDQSVLLLKSGNDITQDMVESDIASYDTTGQSNGVCCGPFWEGRGKRSIWWPYVIQGKDPYSMFENSGVLVMTDAFLYREVIPSNHFWGKEGGRQMAPMGAAAGKIAQSRPDEAPADQKSIAPSAEEKSKPTASESSTTRLRTYFPETWIWTGELANANGETVYKADVPDTITSWITSAFAINEASGLGVAPEPAKLQVFRPFFIRLNLPYSVKRNEKLALQVLIFNYMDSDQTVTVTLEKNDDFDFVEKPNSDKQAKQKIEGQNIRVINVKNSGGSSAVYFPILPKTVGDLRFLVKATASGGAGDAVEQPLLVEAEGYPLFFNKPELLDLTSTQRVERSLTIDPPQDSEIIPGSEKISVSIIGDVMGPVLNNIEGLIRMSYGCGEQNMLNFVPNIVVYRYLNITNRLTAELKQRSINYLEAGLQRELTYKRNDNSFSAFGNSDRAGSTWLTAFVIRSFKQAQPYIFVDDNILTNGLNFLKAQQLVDGSFAERGEIHHKDMQGGAASGVPLTAYVLTAFLINDRANPEGIAYLEKNLDSIKNDSYALAVTAYALQLAGSPQKEAALDALEKLAKKDIEGMKYWARDSTPELPKETPWYYQSPPPANVEMTSYALLTYMLRNQVADGISIVRWLATQRNSLGGFSSTQDTVIGLQALGSYAEKAYSPSLDLSIDISQGETKYTSKVGPDNAIVLQQYKFTKMDAPVQIVAAGSGIAFAQLAYHYNVANLKTEKPFNCTNNIKQTVATDLVVNICCNYALKGRSNMVVVNVDTPSGFTIDGDQLQHLTSTPNLQRVETTKGDTQAAIYMNSLGPEPLCFDVYESRAYFVAEQKPAHITVVDYYEPAHKIDMEYVTKQALSLDHVCGLAECWPEDVPVAALREAAVGTKKRKHKKTTTAAAPEATTVQPEAVTQGDAATHRKKKHA